MKQDALITCKIEKAFSLIGWAIKIEWQNLFGPSMNSPYTCFVVASFLWYPINNLLINLFMQRLQILFFFAYPNKEYGSIVRQSTVALFYYR